MRFSTIIFAGVMPFLTAAAPTQNEVSMMAAAPQWTMESMQRVCNAANTECKWTFRINEKTGAPVTPCAFTVKKNGAKPASETDASGFKCGVYTVSTGWSGQFGAGNGFTTLSVVNNKSRLIVWPAYQDKQLAAGKVVKPDQSYAPVRLG